MGGKGKKKIFFLGAHRSSAQSSGFCIRLFIESGLRFSGCLSVNRIREIMAALGPVNCLINARKAPRFETHSSVYKIDGFSVLNNKIFNYNILINFQDLR